MLSLKPGTESIQLELDNQLTAIPKPIMTMINARVTSLEISLIFISPAS